MARRIDWLTEVAKPVADKLAARCGSLKKVLSAGVMVLNEITPEQREYFMAKADGLELEPLQNEAEFRRKVLQILKDSQKIPAEKKRGKRANSSKRA